MKKRAYYKTSLMLEVDNLVKLRELAEPFSASYSKLVRLAIHHALTCPGFRKTLIEEYERPIKEFKKA